MSRAAEASENAESQDDLGKDQIVFIPDVGTIEPGTPYRLQMNIPEGASLAITIAAPEGISVTVLSPSGSVVAEDPMGAPPFRQYRAQSPIEGTWRVILENELDEPAGARISFLVQESHVVLHVQAEPDPNIDQVISIKSWVTDRGLVARPEWVTGELVGRSGETVDVPLFDDGQHGDGSANDGVFGNTVRRPSGFFVTKVTSLVEGVFLFTHEP